MLAFNYRYTPPPALNLPTITLTVRAKKLVGLDWSCQKTQHFFGEITYLTILDNRDDNHAVLLQTVQQLDEYFAGKRQVFDIPIDLSVGTPFQQAVWQALCQISYGQTISYAKLAKQISRPTAFRACANANGKNPISIIVPCHRVIASDGSLGGYTGGITIKQTLLRCEGIT